MPRNGVFIVLEGTDGSGKATQFNLLAKRLKEEGYDLATFDFPRYDQPSSYFVKEYLNGSYGTAEEVGPYTGSLFYALDRYSAATQIKQALEAGKVVLSNRYTGSNMAHQGTKFDHVEQRRGFFIWLDNLEFEMLGIPRPDLSLVLRVPADVAQKLVDKKEQRNYTDKKRDLHEADLNHMQRSVEVYDDLCQLFPKDFHCLDCVRTGQLLDKQTVHKLVWESVRPLLPPKKNSIVQEPTEALSDNAFVTKTESGYHVTEAGRAFLNQAVTNTEANVYAFTDKLSAMTIAAAMARLSRRGDDMRITILDEFASTIGRDEKLLQRVITAYGDDSVQQLVAQHAVVEGASNLLTKKLEWGRLAAYLEQSTRYIYFDQKDQNGQYKYYTPSHFDAKTRRHYRLVMDEIFDLYSEMVHSLTNYLKQTTAVPKAEQDGAWLSAVRAQACDAVRPVLPVATKSTVGIFASGQALESLIMHLQGDALPEAQATGRQLLEEARKTIPTFLERADRADRGGAMVAYQSNTRAGVKKFADQHLANKYSQDLEAVELVEYWPRNEMDLLADMLYEHTNLSVKEIDQETKSWPYERRLAAFQAYMGERLNRRHKPGRALEKAHYSWDLLCDYGIFRDLQRHRMVDDLQWQNLTPRYGYDVPELVDNANLTDQFEKCFVHSLKLYDFLQQADYELEAQYATLLGHKMRWKVTYNAREAFHLHELRTSPQGHPGYRKLVQQMHAKLTEAHPLIAEAMKFVNQGEDPELARLAAERYTQFKLGQLKPN